MTKKPIRSRPPRARPPLGVADVRDRHLTGYGSPEGVVSAGAGVAYQDTDPAGTGAQWKKTTPSGNTGWVEVGGAAAANPYGRFAAYASASLGTFTAGASVHQINFDAVWLDPDGLYDIGTHRYVPLEAGTYFLGVSAYFENTVDTWAQLRLHSPGNQLVGGFNEGFYPNNAGVYGGIGVSHGYIEAHGYVFLDVSATSVWAELGVSQDVTVKPPTTFWGWRVSDDNIYA